MSTIRAIQNVYRLYKPKPWKTYDFPHLHQQTLQKCLTRIHNWCNSQSEILDTTVDGIDIRIIFSKYAFFNWQPTVRFHQNRNVQTLALQHRIIRRIIRHRNNGNCRLIHFNMIQSVDASSLVLIMSERKISVSKKKEFSWDFFRLGPKTISPRLFGVG